MNQHYQVLARKYRPHIFSEMVGQTHTIKTLINALDANNLHHAFLFTGTRGVGKTTIARIFAKSINCEQGVSPSPCNQCSTCLEINKGQSIDLIELDAASHTGVDNMRDILENAQYMPAKNRYKIYLIDEVHMLSTSSFNALLKTLEEPPEHIKFLLATTVPQKLPITVLSRCLQFTLQKLTHEEILNQLKFIMEAEGLKYETLALSQIADFGHGSMRDALSLLDQSISYGNGTIMTEDIKAMLGLVHHDDILALATHLFNQDAQAVINFIKNLSHKGENLTHALKDLTSLFHQITIAKIINNTPIEQQVKALALQVSNQDLQLFYHIAIKGAKDMPLAPSEQIGLEMTLLSMLSFHSNAGKQFITQTTHTKPQEDNQGGTAKIVGKPKTEVKVTKQETVEKKTKKNSPKIVKDITSQAQWETIITSLKFNTAAQMLLKNTLFESIDNQVLTLTLDEQFSTLLTDNIQESIQSTLQEKFNKLTLKINLNKLTKQTLAQKETQANQGEIKAMQTAFLNDKGVQKLQQTFNTKVDITSIEKTVTNQER